MTLDALFIKIQSHIDNKLPFVAYNLPGSDYVKVFFKTITQIISLLILMSLDL